MALRSPIPSCIAAAACLAALADAPRAGAQLTSEGTRGSAVAYGATDVADVSSAPGPGVLDVSLGAAASNSQGLSLLLWESDFTFDASALGTGSLSWGSAAAAITLSASAKPQLVYATPLNQGNGPLGNNGSAGADARVNLQFTDVATVTSATLPAGTPVSLTLHVGITSTGIATGAGPDSFTGASFTGRLASLSASLPELERLVIGNQIAEAPFDTAVGDQLRIQGALATSGEVHAGYRSCCLFTTDVDAGTSVSSAGLWISTPEGVDLAAESGADYTQPAPEPTAGAAAALAALGALRGWARQCRRASVRRAEEPR